ncbi:MULTISPECIES: hypothetical protein [unclassified Paenibacillus]|uniref:hypothetical protein n=1 Tax=unclassified Paenibacillus TaxID=185978 RepID=UPI00041336AA|nr:MULTISPECIES: hypothetical protein [unclassified Paenibacillus]KGP85297.1 PTS ascorbate transporter subunit IIC [Paenibacillus sp. MAEPY2]KGP88147.1 PTS ascorbate transporter subunit IIC [Paenibacillus sp. MAEPY1]
MNVSDLWDFSFFWQMFRNNMATVSPFVMVVVAPIVVGILITVIIKAVTRAKA